MDFIARLGRLLLTIAPSSCSPIARPLWRNIQRPRASAVPSYWLRSSRHNAATPTEDRPAAQRKAAEVVTRPKDKKLGKAAELVETAVSETLAYYAFPEERWRGVRPKDYDFRRDVLGPTSRNAAVAYRLRPSPLLQLFAFGGASSERVAKPAEHQVYHAGVDSPCRTKRRRANGAPLRKLTILGLVRRNRRWIR